MNKCDSNVKVILDGDIKYVIDFDEMHCDVVFTKSNTVFDRLELEIVSGDVCSVDESGHTLMFSDFQVAYKEWLAEKALLGDVECQG